ncbi:MAG: DUF456 domain-containing protein [Bacteroidaceae bacterium]|nr:DUF456 domain-containing protein [Bacteroidaceae bacterium]
MEIVLITTALILGVLGLLGTILPILPGTILSYLSLLCISFLQSSSVDGTDLVIWGIITILVVLSDYYLPGYFSKLCGGTKAGITGATIGAIFGIFIMGPLGIILGPFVGAVLGEMMSKKLPLRQAVIVGFGALLSFFVGTGIKLIVGIWMMVRVIAELM